MKSSNKRKRSRTVIGYIRVSTQRQARDGIGLEGQRAAIEKFCELEGYRIAGWYQDAASGMGEDNAAKREGLTHAIDEARSLRCPIVVNKLCRLSRDTRAAENIVVKGNVNVISTDGSTLTPLSVRSNAARAEAEGIAIAERTSKALQARKAAGVQLGNRTNLDQAQKKGAAANKTRATATAEEIADHLEILPGREAMSAREVTDSLNAAGIQSSRGNAWTMSAIRRPLAEAKKVLEERSASHKDLGELPGFGRFG